MRETLTKIVNREASKRDVAATVTMIHCQIVRAIVRGGVWEVVERAVGVVTTTSSNITACMAIEYIQIQ